MAIDVKLLAKQLVGLHLMAGMITKAPEIVLNDAEAMELAKALAEVAKHYEIKIDPKVQAWFGLGATAAGLYGPRALAVLARKVQERKDKRAATQGPVPGVEEPPPVGADLETPQPQGPIRFDAAAE